MLKIRLIGVVLVKEGIAVQSVGFRRYLPIGKPEIAIEYLDRWGIDEIAVLYMDAAKRGVCPTASEVAVYSKRCRVPLSVGGGITTVETITRIIQAGADKVILNAAAVSQPTLIEQAALLFGEQCVVVSIDARRRCGSDHETFTHSGTRATGLSAMEHAARVVSHGAGEILLNSIDCDGARNGYDVDLIRSVAGSVEVPVIACGGAGHPDHMAAAIEAGASAVAAANFFHYVEHSVILVKRALRQTARAVRLDSYVDYAHHSLDADGRLAKQRDEALDRLRFRYVAEEII